MDAGHSSRSRHVEWGVGRRGERRRLTGGRCGWSLKGERTTPGEEMGSGCTESEVVTTNSTYGGAVLGMREIV